MSSTPAMGQRKHRGTQLLVLVLKIGAPEQREYAKKKQNLLGDGRKVGVHMARRPARVLLGWLKRTKSHHMSQEEEEKGTSWSQ